MSLIVTTRIVPFQNFPHIFIGSIVTGNCTREYCWLIRENPLFPILLQSITFLPLLRSKPRCQEVSGVLQNKHVNHNEIFLCNWLRVSHNTSHKSFRSEHSCGYDLLTVFSKIMIPSHFRSGNRNSSWRSIWIGADRWESSMCQNAAVFV